MTSTVHATGRASPFVLTYVAEILPQSESLELKICAIHLHSSLTAMNGVFSRGTDKTEINQAMPDWKVEIRRRLTNLRLAPAREATVIEELVQYLEDCYAELLAGGVAEAEAYRQTLAELNGSELFAR